jgi:hypothetical protein
VEQASSLLTVEQASSLLGAHAEVLGRLEACPTGWKPAPPAGSLPHRLDAPPPLDHMVFMRILPSMSLRMFHRRRLPHWESPGSPLFVTSCLAGSLSAAGMLDVRRFHQRLARRNSPAACTKKTWQRKCEALVFRRRDAWLDGQRDGSLLASPRIAAIVRDAMLHFNGLRYDVFAYVIMPSHLHWIFRPRAEWVEELEMQGSVRSPRETIRASRRSCGAATG